MNARRKFALVCSFLGFVLASACLYRTTPLSMMAFFSGALPLFALGIIVYLLDLAIIALRLRQGGLK
ncbi:MAG: hypothetical protein HY403_11955 [Elusimicrobia bacterium]|nr:hypothetical protein [Elusimicrobiota bacterium]